MENSLKTWAVYYARSGLAVFPLESGGKRPIIKHGHNAASNDIHQIEKWWNNNPNSNIGIATGKVSGGLFVIDLDVDKDKGLDGRETLREWESVNGKLPDDTWLSITGRGGYHIFYRDSSTVRCRTNLYDGVDIRGDGGYIVAPPSIHPNGRCYEWEQDPEEFRLLQATSVVFDFINPLVSLLPKGFELPEQIPAGQRTNYMVKMVCSMQSKGASDSAIRVAVQAENEAKCIPSLTDGELEKQVFPALKRYVKGTTPYKAVFDGGKFRSTKNHSLEIVTMDKVAEKEADWLVTNYMPRGQITSLAGDGGSGKTTVWCAIAAAISNGSRPFLLDGLIPLEFAKYKPETVMFFSAEDSFEYTLTKRLRKNGAKLENIYSINIADERFQDIKFNNPLLENLLEKYRPSLCIFDPIQAFVPPNIRMGDRNAMRSCMAPLIGYGEKYGTTFLIIEHANKQSGVWGRKRIADSADIWDISRSVIMAGETSEKGVRYLSHEKSNYGMPGETILYSIDDEVIQFRGYTFKKDKDYVTEVDYSGRQLPQREEAKEFILEYLADGEKEVSDLDAMSKAQSISANSVKNAKAELRKDGKIKYRNTGQGQNKKFYVSLIATEKTNE
jgi:hypothetical protein